MLIKFTNYKVNYQYRTERKFSRDVSPEYQLAYGKKELNILLQ